MRTVRINEREYPVDYCGIGYMGMLKMQLQDSRPLGEIAPEFEGAETLVYTNNEDEPVAYEGFKKLNRLEYVDENAVVVILMKPEV